jgi:glycosyltransferase involved in cell wall biosynthesis
MVQPRSISVLMPTWQGRAYLARVLEALAAQRIDVPWDFRAVDSGSTDGTLELLEQWSAKFPVPFAIQRIHSAEFDHGDTRNLLAAESAGELLVYLTQDAIPSSPDWLKTLHANFAASEVGAAYCRNLPRPDAELLTRVFSENDPGYVAGRREVTLPVDYATLDAHARRLLYNFNDVASAIRRELWVRHPFPRTEFGEDLLMARALLEAGHTVVYDDAATVEHSHDYAPDEMRARARVDAKFSAQWLDRICVGSAEDADTLVGRQLERDREALEQAGVTGSELDAQLERARELRHAAFHGLYEGGLTERRRASTALRESGSLHVLYVVHGFPPDTWAGTEVYTLELAKAMQRRGHRVTVLTRTPGAPETEGAAGAEDFSLEETEYDGLSVWRLTHRLAHERLRDTYDQPKAVRAFREVLLRVKPDLVHFQHLIHTSVGLVAEAREHNLPTVIHCHDYWSVCARVQLIRPDGVRCQHNMGSGCYLCVQDTHLAHVDRVAELDERAPEALEAAACGERRARVLGRDGFDDLRARQDVVLPAWSSADLRISPSRFLRERLLDSGAFDPHTFLYSDNGMRTDHVRALDKQRDAGGRVRFGFVGSLVWYKGGQVLVEAMQLLADAPVVLNVHGDFKPDEDEHHAQLAELAGDNVVFHGRFDNQRLSEVYAEIDVLVVPSVWYENSPITIHEAHLTNTPVVTSGIGGMAEYVRDGVDGLHFEVGEAADLARVLRRFVDEPGLLGQLARDFPHIKTVEENARETEFRYRALCCRRREEREAVLLALDGVDSAERSGPVEVQGADLLLLRPGGAADYGVELVGAGRRTVRVDVLALGSEGHLPLGGRATLDGRELGAIGPFTSPGEDARRSFALEAEFPDGARTLRLEATDGLHLRVAGVVVSAQTGALS